MQKELESLWQQCVAFHGHGCGGLAVGFRAVLYAWELFGCDSPSEDEKIVLPPAMALRSTIRMFSAGIPASQPAMAAHIPAPPIPTTTRS